MAANTDLLQQYHINGEFVRGIKRKYIVFATSIWVLLFIIDQIAPGSWQSDGKNVSPTLNLWLNVAQFTILSVITVVIIYFTAGSKYEGYMITLNDRVIGKTNKNNQNKIIELSQIAYVVKTSRGSLFVYDSKKNILVIPYAIDGYDELKKVIAESSPIWIDGPYSIYQKYSLATVFLFVAMLLTMLALTNKILESIVALFIISGVALVFKSGYDKIKRHQVVANKRLLIAPTVFILIILIALIKKLMEK
ncbi:adaptor complexes medium subunit family protein [Mucilaginibacter ginsenosidivorans]|uniref:Uncharacterized protein n=1 Tax=Mucilaginibacter ginsenosidivorans TaxID=398053 RepID=A0A5B8UWU8_9SPHI|nr:hypothetical protein [Mucilaginibacter ginsenosidivorans]QEC63378.1 hypothetical protein FRZ54_12595 [Mucilaginibacter ginsenosidivorans]